MIISLVRLWLSFLEELVLGDNANHATFVDHDELRDVEHCEQKVDFAHLGFFHDCERRHLTLNNRIHEINGIVPERVDHVIIPVTMSITTLRSISILVVFNLLDVKH